MLVLEREHSLKQVVRVEVCHVFRQLPSHPQSDFLHERHDRPPRLARRPTEPAAPATGPGFVGRNEFPDVRCGAVDDQRDEVEQKRRFQLELRHRHEPRTHFHDEEREERVAQPVVELALRCGGAGRVLLDLGYHSVEKASSVHWNQLWKPLESPEQERTIFLYV